MSPTADRDRRFTEQLQRHHRRLYGYVFTLLRNHQDAQDVFQQTSLVLWEKFDEFQPDTNFLTWACTVARFKAARLPEAAAPLPRPFQRGVSTPPGLAAREHSVGRVGGPQRCPRGPRRQAPAEPARYVAAMFRGRSFGGRGRQGTWPHDAQRLQFAAKHPRKVAGLRQRSRLRGA